MKKRTVLSITCIVLFIGGLLTGFMSPDILTNGWKVFKGKAKKVTIGPTLDGKGIPPCCTFEDGTKCYSSDCSFCGCSGIKLEDMKQSRKSFQVQMNRKGDIRVNPAINSSKNEGGSYCCTFDDGTKCYSSDCSFCGC